MPREAKAYLHDMRQAASLISEFTEGLDFDAYAADAMVRAAVEREFDPGSPTTGSSRPLLVRLRTAQTHGGPQENRSKRTSSARGRRAVPGADFGRAPSSVG